MKKSSLITFAVVSLYCSSAWAGTLPVQGAGASGSGVAAGSFFTPVPAPIVGTGAQMNVDIPDSGTGADMNVDIPDATGTDSNIDIPDSENSDQNASGG